MSLPKPQQPGSGCDRTLPKQSRVANHFPPPLQIDERNFLRFLEAPKASPLKSSFSRRTSHLPIPGRAFGPRQHPRQSPTRYAGRRHHRESSREADPRRARKAGGQLASSLTLFACLQPVLSGLLPSYVVGGDLEEQYGSFVHCRGGWRGHYHAGRTVLSIWQLCCQDWAHRSQCKQSQRGSGSAEENYNRTTLQCRRLPPL